MSIGYPIKEFDLYNEQCKILNSGLSLHIFFFCFRAKFILPDSSNDENTNDDNPNDKEDNVNEDMKDDIDDGDDDGQST
ncbi:unnamed protein product, partial [Rotaria socialis]